MRYHKITSSNLVMNIPWIKKWEIYFNDEKNSINVVLIERVIYIDLNKEKLN